MNKTIIKFIAILLPLILMSCKEAREAKEIIEDVKVSRLDVEGAYKKYPYAEAEQLIFSKYFRGIAKLALILKENKSTLLNVEAQTNFDWDDEEDGFYSEDSERVSSQKFDVGKLCEEMLIAPGIWQEIEENCYYNEYFVCSEEIKNFDEVLLAIYSDLDSKNKSKFESKGNCRAWMPLLNQKLSQE